MFASIFRKLSDTGSHASNRGQRKKRVRTLDLEEIILYRVEVYPHVSSTRQLAAVTKKDIQLCGHTYEFKYLVLAPVDYPARVNFCQWYLQHDLNSTFDDSVLYTDETTFKKDEIANFHNKHV